MRQETRNSIIQAVKENRTISLWEFDEADLQQIRDIVAEVGGNRYQVEPAQKENGTISMDTIVIRPIPA